MLRRHGHPPTEAELAALADGSLTGARRARVEALVAASPELERVVAEQRLAVSLVQRAAVPAPSELRSRLEGSAPAPRARRRLVLAPALAAGAIVVVLAGVLATVGSGGPSVAQAAQLATRPALAAAPAGNVGALLPRLRAAGLPYPYWEDHFGWRATGVRRDRLSGRVTTTVFYRRGTERIAYTIVPGDALGLPAGARVVTRPGPRVSLSRTAGRIVATWLRRGHTCVLSGAGVPSGVLVRLAAWRADGKIPY